MRWKCVPRGTTRDRVSFLTVFPRAAALDGWSQSCAASSSSSPKLALRFRGMRDDRRKGGFFWAGGSCERNTAAANAVLPQRRDGDRPSPCGPPSLSVIEMAAWIAPRVSSTFALRFVSEGSCRYPSSAGIAPPQTRRCRNRAKRRLISTVLIGRKYPRASPKIITTIVRMIQFQSGLLKNLCGELKREGEKFRGDCYISPNLNNASEGVYASTCS